MKLLVDMNLSPLWVDVLKGAGHDALHWSMVGAPNATDRVIMEWAVLNEYVVFTHDLDFGAILAATRGRAPSVIQMRAQDVSPEACAGSLLDALNRYGSHLRQGSLVTIDEKRARVRILPLFGR